MNDVTSLSAEKSGQDIPSQGRMNAVRTGLASPEVGGGLVDFDVFWTEPIDKDTSNPMSWSAARRWGVVAAVSFITFLT